jgi:hypothetical protein
MQMLKFLIYKAKKNLVRDGALEPVFILAVDEDLITAQPLATLARTYERAHPGEQLNMEDTKTRDTFAIGGLAAAIGANRVILIWDGAFRTCEKDVPYDPTQTPLTYPKSMRTECIIINEVLLPSGKDRTVVIPYKGEEGEPVEFLPDDKFKKAGTDYKSRFTEIILSGYNRGLEVTKGRNAE